MGKGICHAQRQYQIPTGFIAFGLEPAVCGQGRLDVEECERCVKGSVCFRIDTSRCYMGRKPELRLKHKIAHNKIMITERNTRSPGVSISAKRRGSFTDPKMQ